MAWDTVSPYNPFPLPLSPCLLSESLMTSTNMQSDNNAKVLLYQCRNCPYTENAVPEPGFAPCVYKNDLVTVSRYVYSHIPSTVHQLTAQGTAGRDSGSGDRP